MLFFHRGAGEGAGGLGGMTETGQARKLVLYFAHKKTPGLAA